jgi:transketolase
MSLRLGDHCGLYLGDLAAQDPRIWVLDGDLADSEGAMHFAQRHPERFVMAGIAEQSMVSMAAGMASCGLRPWVFSFAAFLCYRAYDQIRVCLSQARQPVTLVASHSGGCSARNGKTHAALNDIALMASLPGMQVWAPAGPRDLRFAMEATLGSSSPSYLRLPRRPLEELDEAPAATWRWLTKPQSVALVGAGLGTHLAQAAHRELAARGISVGLLHCLQVSPLPEGLLHALREVEHAFIIEDHSTFGGLASLLRHANVPCRLEPIGWPMDWTVPSGNDEEVLRLGGLSADALARRVATAIGRQYVE